MGTEIRIEEAVGGWEELLPLFALSTGMGEAAIWKLIRIEEAKGTRYWVARGEDGEALGMVGLYVAEVEEVRELYPPEIIDVAVLERCQGQGIGKRLVAMAVEEARSSGDAYVYLFTGAGDVGNIGFYRACGFRLVSIVPGDDPAGGGKAWLRAALR